MRKVLFLTVLLASMLVLSCSDNQDSPNGPGEDPIADVDTLTVLPTSGAPGSLVTISGYTGDPTDSTISVYIGDEPTVFLVDSLGISALIPLFLDSASSWSQPPAGPQEVTISVDTQMVAIAEAALTIDSLPHADGATDSILADLQVMSSSMHSIWDALGSSPESDPRLPGYRTAILAMMDSILAGTDSSIAALIEGRSSWNDGQEVDMALIDAILASSGAVQFYHEVVESFGQLNGALRAAQSRGLLCKGGGPDMDLACEMQVYVVLDNYATYFVRPTTTTYANTVGLTAGLLAVTGVGLAGEAIIGALLTVFDFVYVTLAPSLFPAEITQFSLDVQSDSIAVDEVTSTTIQISATNRPATIRASDILDQLLAMLGLAKASEAAKNFRDVLTNAMKWALDLYRKAIVQYNKDNGGEVFIDPEADLPTLNWGPVTITHSDLVELFSFTEDIIMADTAAFEWEGVSRGEGRIQARGRGAGNRSKVLYDNALCWGCVYTGGAFGENAPGTETHTVIVGKPAKLQVEIDGLPNGTDASVIVSGPEYSSGVLTATETLSDLEPGSYTVTAIEVLDGDGNSYLPDPVDTSVTLDDGDYQTVTITYEAEYGNLLLTVAGLPEGVDADIDIFSPESGGHHTVSDTLLDSLTPGEYTIDAREVLDLDGMTVLRPSPESQTVTVIGGETATAAVEYSPEASMKVFFGSYTHTLGYVSDYYRPFASATCGSSSDGQSHDGDSIFVPDLSINSDCLLEGGLEMDPGDSYSFSSSCGSGTASGDVSLTIQYATADEIYMDASVNMSATAPSPTDNTPFEQYSANAYTGTGETQKLIIEIHNGEGKNLAFEITYSASSSWSSDPGVSAGAGLIANMGSLQGQYAHCYLPHSASWYKAPYFEDEPSYSGVDTMSLEHATLDQLYLGVSMGGQATALTYTDQNGEAAQTMSSQASAVCSYRIKLIELP